MWKFKHFSQKEQTGLEGRMLDVGSYKIQVRNVIAEGGFSCVYLARDLLNGSKQYALKHMICNDSESLELVMKEISVMKTLIGHPNVVYLHAHAIFDMGRTKEALLLMEYCEKSLISVLDGRGAGFFEEKQALTIFRDVCNAVFAMHCQNPPIAHRDLKAENLLLGHDGSWKLCDFGSTSTNHKRFEKPEEMGIEEDIIRKHTTPAYRAPEMWDLFRKEPINEKVDIWALGCLLYRICYLKLAFDGESKLQVLNGNYQIPDLPKYNNSLTDLIRDMLQPSPVDRPDITQVWLRVNNLLPESIQKSLPDRPPEMPEPKSDMFAGVSNVVNNSSPAPRRSPPPPPSSARQASTINNFRASGNTEPLGSFWTTQHAKVDVTDHKTSVKSGSDRNTSVRKNSADYSVNKPSDFSSKDFDLFPEDRNGNAEAIRQSKPDAVPAFRNDAGNKQRPISNLQNTGKEMTLEAEVEKLKKQLANVTAEKANMGSKYEKLAAICRSQREEIQDLKHALAARTPSPQSRDSSRASTGSHSIGTPVNDKIQGTVLELQQAFFGEASPSSNSNQWHAFEDDTKPPLPTNNAPRSFRTKTNPPNNQPQISPQPPSISSSWEFETGSFKVTPSPSSGEFKVPQRFGETKSTQNKLESQPAGWAGF